MNMAGALVDEIERALLVGNYDTREQFEIREAALANLVTMETYIKELEKMVPDVHRQIAKARAAAHG